MYVYDFGRGSSTRDRKTHLHSEINQLILILPYSFVVLKFAITIFVIDFINSLLTIEMHYCKIRCF